MREDGIIAELAEDHLRWGIVGAISLLRFGVGDGLPAEAKPHFAQTKNCIIRDGEIGIIQDPVEDRPPRLVARIEVEGARMVTCQFNECICPTAANHCKEPLRAAGTCVLQTSLDLVIDPRLRLTTPFGGTVFQFDVEGVIKKMSYKGGPLVGRT